MRIAPGLERHNDGLKAAAATEPGVSKSPGAIVFTRIPYWLRSRAAGSVIPTTPPFEAE